jgi:hypothetical protein
LLAILVIAVFYITSSKGPRITTFGRSKNHNS